MAIFARAVAAVVGRVLPLSLRQAMHKWDLGYWHEWRRATGLQGIGGIGYDQQMAFIGIFLQSWRYSTV